MRRLYFVTHSIDDAERLVTNLQHAGLSEWRIHGLSQDDAALYHHHIHPAHLFQRYDLIHLGERGAMIGFLVSLLWATAIHYANVIPGSFGIAETAFTIMFFTLFGAWTGGLVGITRINYRIARFQQDIAEGACLILVDAHRRQERQIKSWVTKAHPDITLAGSSSTFTNPFSRAVKKAPESPHSPKII
ncbi:hypothetical protein [Parendozoicomonas haliclonae]|uniref:Uncharacterized protein n=1 Tax=Parendozoicomonas haliclonae TaxID=1960125 RepID=A0A1X7AN19_9GAMM|nr:hypothetical protein [Parendozoicomonas haliclonae]SMA49449.1 hypothetical protein EHSB41UT_03269 [Parendozoicomonas haliclonae]